MSEDNNKPLQKITTITLAGKDYDLAKNGEYALVESRGEDAYGRPISARVDLNNWLSPTWAPDEPARGHILTVRVQALLDALGDATVRLQSQRDARLAARGEKEG